MWITPDLSKPPKESSAYYYFQYINSEHKSEVNKEIAKANKNIVGILSNIHTKTDENDLKLSNEERLQNIYETELRNEYILLHEFGRITNLPPDWKNLKEVINTVFNNQQEYQNALSDYYKAIEEVEKDSSMEMGSVKKVRIGNEKEKLLDNLFHQYDRLIIDSLDINKSKRKKKELTKQIVEMVNEKHSKENITLKINLTFLFGYEIITKLGDEAVEIEEALETEEKQRSDRQKELIKKLNNMSSHLEEIYSVISKNREQLISLPIVDSNGKKITKSQIQNTIESLKDAQQEVFLKMPKLNQLKAAAAEKIASLKQIMSKGYTTGFSTGSIQNKDKKFTESDNIYATVYIDTERTSKIVREHYGELKNLLYEQAESYSTSPKEDENELSFWETTNKNIIEKYSKIITELDKIRQNVIISEDTTKRYNNSYDVEKIGDNLFSIEKKYGGTQKTTETWKNVFEPFIDNKISDDFLNSLSFLTVQNAGQTAVIDTIRYLLPSESFSGAFNQMNYFAPAFMFTDYQSIIDCSSFRVHVFNLNDEYSPLSLALSNESLKNAENSDSLRVQFAFVPYNLKNDESWSGLNGESTQEDWDANAKMASKTGIRLLINNRIVMEKKKA